MEKDKVFNLQMTIQKLEEELALYRNGTTAGELLELLNEKDSELEEVKAKLSSKEDTLRKIAKSSAEVLSKFDALSAEKTQLENETLKLLNQLAQSEEQLQTVVVKHINEVKGFEQTIRNMNEIVDEHRLTNEELKSALAGKTILIEQLKIRVANFEQDSATNSINEEQLMNLRRSISDKDASIKSLKENLSDCDRSIEKLQKRCADLVAEKGDKFKQLDQERQEMIAHVQKFRESMTANIAQRDEALKRKDEKIKELNFQVTLLGQEVKMKAQRLEEGLAERNSFWQCKVTDLEMKLQDLAMRGPQDLLKSSIDSLSSHGNQENRPAATASTVAMSAAVGRKVLKERTNSSEIHFDPAELVKGGGSVLAAPSAAGGSSRVTRAAVFSVYNDKL